MAPIPPASPTRCRLIVPYFQDHRSRPALVMPEGCVQKETKRQGEKVSRGPTPRRSRSSSHAGRGGVKGDRNQVVLLKTLTYDYHIVSIELMDVIVVDSAVDHLREAATRRSGHAGHGTDRPGETSPRWCRNNPAHGGVRGAYRISDGYSRQCHGRAGESGHRVSG